MNRPPQDNRTITDRNEKGVKNERKVLQIDRVSRTVRGGKRVRFRALVVVGNRSGRVGIGIAKAGEVVGAVAKAAKIAEKKMIEAPIVNETIPFQVKVSSGAAQIILKPAPRGTSLVAGGTIRVICELAGIKNISAKILGSANKINNAKAMMIALEKLKNT